METNTKSNLVLNNRQDMSLTGIIKVRSSEPNQIIAMIDNGNIIIHGQNLSVQQLDIKEGTLQVTGTVNAIKYSNQISKSFSFKNMFK